MLPGVFSPKPHFFVKEKCKSKELYEENEKSADWCDNSDMFLLI